MSGLDRPKRPLLETADLNPFGTVNPDEAWSDDGATFDPFYVAGYSDKVQERDRRIAAVARGEASLRDVPTLPGHLRWARRVTPKEQAPDGVKILSHTADGFKPVSYTEVASGKHPYITSLPAGAVRGPSDEIVMGDLMLMSQDVHTAARRAAYKQRMVADSAGGSNPYLDRAAAINDQKPAANLTHTVEAQAPVEVTTNIRRK